MIRESLLCSITAFTLATPPLTCIAQATSAGQVPPRSWVDKDTGHRVWRLSDEPNSGGFYFNVNAYTPDHKQMIYTAPDGIHVLDMDTRKTRLLVPNPPAAPKPPPTPARFAEPAPAAIRTPSSPAARPTASSSPSRPRHPRRLRLQGRHQHRRHPQARPTCPPKIEHRQRQRRRDPRRRHLHRRRRHRQGVRLQRPRRPSPPRQPTIASPAPPRARTTSPTTRAR